MTHDMTDLQERVLKILRRMEPTAAIRAFRELLPTMRDTEILEYCQELGIRLDRGGRDAFMLGVA